MNGQEIDDAMDAVAQDESATIANAIPAFQQSHRFMALVRQQMGFTLDNLTKVPSSAIIEHVCTLCFFYGLHSGRKMVSSNLSLEKAKVN